MDADLLNKRKEVLREIDKLLVLCKCNNNNSKKTTCVHCKGIEKLGASLLKLLIRYKKNDGVKKAEKLKTKVLDFDSFLQYKKSGMTDISIGEIFGMTKAGIDKWKRENNIKSIDIRRKIEQGVI
ncbi:hypothetical protein FC756_26710 [Lysinibacillus mangiferihumi]|uniref:Zinc-finger domain-containing protein n=1 Tax=Lysinibacillus mangiferihumi TaxID=1130819 RepID=A0A4U2XYC0_9BACI|nr:hypothetical protein [Lysinibacillus mangiferihumi]TKI52899.1 hypothetical protein FC756_26710 [Lysinibacillus mangiferihumi]